MSLRLTPIPVKTGSAGRWAPRTISSHNGHVIKTSLAHAKAHLSELVDQAEHKNRRIVILVTASPPRRLSRSTSPPPSDSDGHRP